MSMEKNEIEDKLFDVLNDTDNLPIHDIVVDDRNNMMNVYLADGTRFSVHVEKCGNWCICEV
jgi:hypothetical protein